MGVILFLLFFFGILIGSFAIPFALIFFAPGKRSAFLIAAGLVYFALWQIQIIQENPNFSERFGTDEWIYSNIIYATIIAGIIKIFLLLEKGKLERQYWSYIDLLLIFILVTTILGNFILGSSGICVSEGRVLNQEEFFPRYVVGKNWDKLSEDARKEEFDKKIEGLQARYYIVSKGRINSLGNYRIGLTIYTRHEPPSHSRDYSEHYLSLNACGFIIGSQGSMSEAEEKIVNNPNLEKVERFDSYDFK